ncbi:uncharacterized protein LOC121982181 [Zingiber officinale]|uniref:Uncharacterized protein n=1 Tax=Zingiber officinale TaxID=94328 RepID=A0A8J5GKL9_ZINOF|nr:uncharacterized protein LOC121982181 [Zingiber officinale]KAG6508844.1 hypothetical protein ZIOFF_034226 [Zingiber officinale]
MEAASKWMTTPMIPSLLRSLPFSNNYSATRSFSSSSSSSFFSTRSHRQNQPLLVSASCTTPPLPSSASTTSFQGMVFDVGSSPSWDSYEIGSPVVKRYLGDDEARWLMWYHGRGDNVDGDSIGIAVSEDGIEWKRATGAVASGDDVGQVMLPNSDWWAFDTAGVRPSDVLIMSSEKITTPGAVYWLYYTGFSQEKLEIASEGAASRSLPRSVSLPGLAISQDGRYWARIEGEHHSGALFEIGSAGEWDSSFVESPKLVYHGREDLRMYYHSFDQANRCYAIGIARSRDGIRWVKLGQVLGCGPLGAFDEAGVRNAHVVRNQINGSYLMAYEGLSVDGVSHIGLAVSLDGLKDWRRCNGKPILEPSTDEDAWDNKGVGAPCLLQIADGRKEEWRLYYMGIGKGRGTRIGMAVSDGLEHGEFKKWVGAQL